MEQQMLPTRPHTQIVQAPPKILASSSANFTRAADTDAMHYYYERPMMLNAWTQTTSEDFDYLFDESIQRKEQQIKAEKDLLEKIRLLEENLREHSEILSQLRDNPQADGGRDHGAATQKNAMQEKPSHHQQQQQQQHPQQTQYVVEQQQLHTTHVVQQQLQHQYQQNHQKQQQQQQQLPHEQAQTHKIHSHQTTSLVNSIHQMSTPTESVKYTIIADANGGPSVEPIEIQIAEDDGAINLNSSADSGRLEICLSEEVDIKDEYPKSESHVTSTIVSVQQSNAAEIQDSIILPAHKRRKVGSDSQESKSSSNYYFNEHGVLTNITSPRATDSPTTSGNNLLPTSVNESYVTYKNIASRNIPKSLHKTPKYELPSTQPPTSASLPPLSHQQRQSFAQQQPQVPRQSTTPGLAQKIDIENIMVSIGPNNTRIPAKVYENMSWSSASISTRKLLMSIFDRQTLATHSMTGKPSPAFKDHGKPLKQMLDPLIIQDIIFAVTRKCHVSEKEVRNAITTKCADENKMMKLQMNKTRSLRELNKENVG